MSRGPQPGGLEAAVAELQGLYGPFGFPERWLQKLWARREYSSGGLVLTTGEQLEVLDPGRWNRLGGPDFKDARLLIGGRPVHGDVEVHFHSGDWARHKHASDPAYRGVVLHVLLFPPAAGEAPARHAGGREIPAVVLLDRLGAPLEDIAADEALGELAGNGAGDAVAALLELAPEERRRRLQGAALQRWRAKAAWARRRIERLGWEQACHSAALEVLGYRANRAAMARIAARWMPADFLKPETVAAALDWPEARWATHGLRPAGRPERRLRQYSAWVAAQPEWPRRWRELAARFPRGEADPLEPVGAVRSRLGLRGLRAGVAKEVCGGALGGCTRLDTLVVDALLPLAGAADGDGLFAPWHAWFLGDCPAGTRTLLRTLGLAGGRDHPAANGWFQGLCAGPQMR